MSETEVYWFDDTGRGGVRVPASWRLLYKNGDQWTPVQTSQAFGVERNAWNAVAFTPVTTSGAPDRDRDAGEVSPPASRNWKIR